jgi:hypothetical protein
MNTTTNALVGLTPDVANSELDTGLTTGLAAVDSLTASRLDNLGLVYQARITQLTRAVNSLTAQAGADAKQVVKAKAAVAATQSTVARVQMVKQRTVATAPVVTSGGWAVWGYVYDSKANPLSGYCVFLTDAQGNYQNAYGFQFTDSNGGFTINYAGTNAEGAQAAATPPTVYLAITNAKAQLVSESAKALALTIGSALYIEITLAAGEPSLGELPGEIKRLAQPDQGVK